MEADHGPDAARAEALERRRFAPSPPCVPWPEPETPPGISLAETGLPAAPAGTLRRIASALDRMHGFRLAHGALDDVAVRLEGETIWFAGVPAEHRFGGNSRSPRARDLAYYSDLCKRAHAG
ncbi:MAG TPA: hypothetical protein VNC50_02800, partial [Planctomycetia bacterium]|nr:hypothetical protein [Planctomycetia bacterium]